MIHEIRSLDQILNLFLQFIFPLSDGPCLKLSTVKERNSREESVSVSIEAHTLFFNSESEQSKRPNLEGSADLGGSNQPRTRLQSFPPFFGSIVPNQISPSCAY
jgi:hypothetical protein